MEIAKKAHRGGLNAWCMAALLDVKNAFNSANWEKIVEGMVKKGVSVYLRNLIREYLSERKIFLDRDTGKEIYIGVPQGSVLGPLLWNILYDGVFEVDLPECVQLVGYADDLVVVGTHRSIGGLRDTMEEAVNRVRDWMTRN